MARRADFEKFIAAQKYLILQRNAVALPHRPRAGKYAAIVLKKCITAAAAFTPCAPPNWTNCQYKKSARVSRGDDRDCRCPVHKIAKFY
jgi:hypothetical protein